VPARGEGFAPFIVIERFRDDDAAATPEWTEDAMPT
jgi:hypothetical protein